MLDSNNKKLHQLQLWHNLVAVMAVAVSYMPNCLLSRLRLPTCLRMALPLVARKHNRRKLPVAAVILGSSKVNWPAWRTPTVYLRCSGVNKNEWKKFKKNRASSAWLPLGHYSAGNNNQQPTFGVLAIKSNTLSYNNDVGEIAADCLDCTSKI